MTVLVTQDRTTKYIAAIREIMSQLGHATNVELLSRLHVAYVDLSPTTVHRITARMVDRGELQMAPSSHDNSMRFDANLLPHDHFMCDHCGLLRDANLSDILRPEVERAIGSDCSISGSLTVSGMCKQCHEENV